MCDQGCNNKEAAIKQEKINGEITSNKGRLQGKSKKSKGFIILIVIILGLVVLSGAHIYNQNKENTKKQEQARIIRAKADFINYSNDVEGTIFVAIQYIEKDALNQVKVFQKHAYGNLNEAVKNYRTSKETEKLYSDYSEQMSKAEKDMNEHTYTIPKELEGDKEVQEIADLLKDFYLKTSDYMEFISSPYGSYESYSIKYNDLTSQVISAYNRCDSRLSYIMSDFARKLNNGNTKK